MSGLFLSYSRKDETFARQLAISLANAGIDVWIDIEDIRAGIKWSKEIQEGLDACEAMIVIVSPDSMASDNVEDEWHYYRDKRKPIIPLLLKPAQIPYQLNRIQYIDFYKQDFQTAFRKLLAELQQQSISTNVVQSLEVRLVRDDQSQTSPYFIDPNGRARAIPDRETLTFLIDLFAYSDPLPFMSSRILNQIKGERLVSIKNWKMPLTPEEKEIEVLERKVNRSLDISDFLFNEEAKPQTITIPIRNNGNEILDIRQAKYMGSNLPTHALIGEVREDLFLLFPFNERLEPGTEFEIVLKLAQFWTASDIRRMRGNLGFLTVEVDYYGTVVEKLIML